MDTTDHLAGMNHKAKLGAPPYSWIGKLIVIQAIHLVEISPAAETLLVCRVSKIDRNMWKGPKPSGDQTWGQLP